METVKLVRVHTPHRNPNDCWNLVLASATGQTYEKIREELGPLMTDEGMLHRVDTLRFLAEHDFTMMIVPTGYKVRTVMHDVKSRFIVDCFDMRKQLHHLAYVDHNTLYTTSETDECFDDPAHTIWVPNK